MDTVVQEQNPQESSVVLDPGMNTACMDEGESKKRLREEDDENIGKSEKFLCKSIEFSVPKSTESSDDSFAERIIEKCLSKAARKTGTLSSSDLRKLPQGKHRREIIDDITVITVNLGRYIDNIFPD